MPNQTKRNMAKYLSNLGVPYELRLFMERLDAFTQFLNQLVPEDRQIKHLCNNVRLSIQMGLQAQKYACTLFMSKIQMYQHRIRQNDSTVFTDNPSSFLEKIPITEYLRQPHITPQVRNTFWSSINDLIDSGLLVHPDTVTRDLMTMAASEVGRQNNKHELKRAMCTRTLQLLKERRGWLATIPPPSTEMQMTEECQSMGAQWDRILTQQ